MPTVRIDTARIHNWASFHDVFAEALGLPEFYGRSLDALADCMFYPDEGDGMMAVVGSVEDPIVLLLTDGGSFKERCPHQWNGIVETVAWLNLQRVENGEPPLLMLAFDSGEPPYVGYGSLEPPLPGEPELKPGWAVVNVTEIQIPATEEARRHMEEIVREMVNLWSISTAESVGRLNRFWLGKQFVSAAQADVLLHEEPSYWAKTIYYGHDSNWWLGEDDLTPVPFP